jgi:hypothetical protein
MENTSSNTLAVRLPPAWPGLRSAAHSPAQVITQLQTQREDRRKHAEQVKKKKQEDSKSLLSQGKFGDSEFVGMIEKYRAGLAPALAHERGEGKINVAVRKRPVSERERTAWDHDAVTCSNPLAVVHHCKLKVDGITKALENVSFEFDHAFDEAASNEEVYAATCLPLVEFAVLHDGRSTCFAYGQTGSGKTHTMEGLHASAARDLFALVRARGKPGARVRCAFFELYGSQCLDLLNDRRPCAVREDGKGEVKVDGLGEEDVADEQDLLDVLGGCARQGCGLTRRSRGSARGGHAHDEEHGDERRLLALARHLPGLPVDGRQALAHRPGRQRARPRHQEPRRHPPHRERRHQPLPLGACAVLPRAPPAAACQP